MFSHISWKQFSVKISLHLHIFGLEHRFDSAIEQVGFPGGSEGKESACNMRDLDLIPRLGRSYGERKGYSLQYSGLENSTDCIVHGAAKSWTQLSDFHFLPFLYLILMWGMLFGGCYLVFERHSNFITTPISSFMCLYPRLTCPQYFNLFPSRLLAIWSVIYHCP